MDGNEIEAAQSELVRQLVAWLEACVTDAEERATVCRRASRVTGTEWHRAVNIMADAHDAAALVYRGHLDLVKRTTRKETGDGSMSIM